jgi:hypothetical protein
MSLTRTTVFTKWIAAEKYLTQLFRQEKLLLAVAGRRQYL